MDRDPGHFLNGMLLESCISVLHLHYDGTSVQEVATVMHTSEILDSLNFLKLHNRWTSF